MATHFRGVRFTDVRRVDETGSTNDDLMDLGRQGAPEGVVLVARHQASGKGRHGRSWAAPPGTGLLCSVLVRPPASVAGLVTATAAVALSDALAELGARGVGVKWPNDLIVATGDGAPTGAAGERKLAGILAEADAPAGSSTASGHRAPGPNERLLVVVGTGVNVHTPDEMPDEMADRAVALDTLVQPAPGVDEVLAVYLSALERRYALLLTDRAAVVDVWRDRCVTIGRGVRVDLGARDLVGRATGVDDDGRLIVQEPDGRVHAVAAGDVVHLRGGASDTDGLGDRPGGSPRVLG